MNNSYLRIACEDTDLMPPSNETSLFYCPHGKSSMQSVEVFSRQGYLSSRRVEYGATGFIDP